MESLDKITFKSPINIDNGYTNIPQGEHESSMELIQYEDRGQIIVVIEWVVMALDSVEHIGIEWDLNGDGKKIVTGYDGVFELPEQAIQLLEKNGFDCGEVKE